MNPPEILFIILLILNVVAYRAKDKKGIRNYFILLAGGSVIQLYFNDPTNKIHSIIYELVLTIVMLRLVATVLGLVSEKFRKNDDFLYLLKCGLVGKLMDIFVFENNFIGMINLYLGFCIVVIVLIVHHFFQYNPVLKIKTFELKLYEFEIIEIPTKLSIGRPFTRKDIELLVIGLYMIWFVVFYRFIPEEIKPDYWIFHQYASLVMAGAFLIIGLLHWRERERII